MASSQRSNEIKVGLFVLLALVVGGVMIIRFGKYTRGLEHAYEINVVFPNVAGLVRDAGVMYAGIPIGKVKDIRLREGVKLKVVVTLAIQEGVSIRRDARFVVNQSGLLGDRYIDVEPGTLNAKVLLPGDEVEGATSVDLTEAIRSVVDVLQQAAQTIARVDQAVARIDETVLSRPTLDHVSLALANLDVASTNAAQLIASLQAAVDENRGKVDQTFTQIQHSAAAVDTAAKRVDAVLAASEGDVRTALTNIVASTVRLDAILARLEKGEGTAGKLLTDPALYDETVQLIRNLRQFGLLYREGAKKKSTDADSSQAPTRGKTPVPARPAQR
jgi:phospholipid/cholesterol/gamma-HCH transport system substrate-binding protein